MLICDHSMHSNCQAPSRDIGQGFASANRIRHLTSGGKFYMEDRGMHSDGAETCHGKQSRKIMLDISAKKFSMIGPDAYKFFKSDYQFQKYLGHPDNHLKSSKGKALL